jgi:hypothetical protein
MYGGKTAFGGATKPQTIQIGSWDVVLMMNLVSRFRVRMSEQKEKVDYHNTMTSHLCEMRNYWLKQNKKTFLDPSLFQSFIISCVGEPVDHGKKTFAKRGERIKNGQAAMFKYFPGGSGPKGNWKFHKANGAECGEKNLKVTRYIMNSAAFEELVKTHSKAEAAANQKVPIIELKQAVSGPGCGNYDNYEASESRWT